MCKTKFGKPNNTTLHSLCNDTGIKYIIRATPGVDKEIGAEQITTINNNN